MLELLSRFYLRSSPSETSLMMDVSVSYIYRAWRISHAGSHPAAQTYQSVMDKIITSYLPRKIYRWGMGDVACNGCAQLCTPFAQQVTSLLLLRDHARQLSECTMYKAGHLFTTCFLLARRVILVKSSY